MKFGGYFFHLDFDPVNANNAQRDVSVSRANGRAMPWEISCWGIRIKGRGHRKGEGTLLGRTDWVHLYIEDGWQITPSLKLDIGLRYEYNQNVTDANNNMAIINTLVPGGEVRHRQQQRRVKFRHRRPLCSEIFRPGFRTSLPRRPAGTTACFRRAPCGWRRASGWPGLCRTTRP